jgi:hypothetical protein
MAFDRNNPTDLQALKSEVETDPTGQDYASASGATQGILEKLNNPAENVSGDTINRPTEELDVPDIAGVIDEGEYSLLNEYNKEWVKMFIKQDPSILLKPYQAKMLDIFPDGSTTRTAILALRQKDASRAEVLWGVNTYISRDDWIAARDS